MRPKCKYLPGLFGASSSAFNFGGASAASQPASSPSVFGGFSTPAFGAIVPASAPAFGVASGSAFGFGGASMPAFGAASTSAFSFVGASAPAFGTPGTFLRKETTQNGCKCAYALVAHPVACL